MEPFKEIFNQKAAEKMARIFSAHSQDFDQRKFVDVATDKLSQLELKARVLQWSKAIEQSFDLNYQKTLKVLLASLAPEQAHMENEWEGNRDDSLIGFLVWPLTQYVQDYGLNHFDLSMNALYEMTKRFSAEFAIRDFLIKDDKRAFRYLDKWLDDPSKHVRRLVSEGSRPRLPWGKSVPVLKKKLQRNLALLEQLKNDPEEYVRRSVANHLNDISRLDDKLMLSTCKRWQRENNKDVGWIVRHASRSLLKSGHPDALALHLYNPKLSFRIKKQGPEIKKQLKKGDLVHLKIDLKHLEKKREKLLVDYVVYFPSKNGGHSRKVFRWANKVLASGESLTLTKSISLKDMSTRTLYAGSISFAVQVNGVERSLFKNHQLKV